MYFDEIYHGRTAFEHLNGMAPYENSHPPLGKVMIMAGIAVFGMNPFGWRVVPALFGIGLVVIFYIFAKRVFKRTSFAAFATVLFASDGMLFVQSRFSTLDSIAVFFIVLMAYWMYRYCEMNFFTDGLRKTMVPLGMCGISFGLGVSTKWIGVYAGIGLAVMFFISLYDRYSEYLEAKYRLLKGSDSEQYQYIVDTFTPNLIKTLLFCVAFFVIIPLTIYMLSYLPYFLCTEKPYSFSDVLGVQEFMFSYHSGLQSTHPFQSKWYTWPFVIRPIYLYSGSHVGEGMMSSIASMGNPILWWTGVIGIIFTLVTLRRRSAQERWSIKNILIMLAAVYLPWTIISRATFIYHFYASVPFMVILLVYTFKYLEGLGMKTWIKWVFAAVCVGVFLLFYPIFSGLEIDSQWGMSTLRWMPSWWFF